MLGAKMSELDATLSLRVSWLVDVGDEIVVDDQAVDVTSLLPLTAQTAHAATIELSKLSATRH